MYRDRCGRTCKDAAGDKKQLSIRRLACQECHRLHRELPDFLLPYKQYICEVIELAIAGESDTLGAENSTILLWGQWFLRRQVHFFGALTAAASIVGESLPVFHHRSGSLLHSIRDYLQSASHWLSKLVRIIVNSGNWVCTEFAFLTDPYPK